MSFRFFVPLVLAFLLGAAGRCAQAQDGVPALPPAPVPARSLPADTAVTHQRTVTIGGEEVPYEVTLGMQPVYGEDDAADASLFYAYYRRRDVETPDRRPLMISFNGGPGAGALWMHLGYTSPKKLRISGEGYPTQPYGIEDNPESILDVADIVYVNPVNTGFSRIVGDGEREQFFGVNEDVAYLAEWIGTFVSRHGRWTSPKFLIGESYGTTRVAGLAGALQGREWMFLNGVVLVSPTGLGLTPPGPSARSQVLKLPYYAAAAWYHGQLPPALQERDLLDVLAEVENYTLEEYLPAAAHGSALGEARREEVTQQVARYAGLSEAFVRDYNMTVPASAFWKELLREDGGYTIGRLDSRYRGLDREVAGDRYDYPAELVSWNHAFAPAINHYLRDDLGFETDVKYNLFGPVRPWNDENNHTGEDLRQAMAENPYLHVLVQSGYYDGATDYFSAKYTLWNLDPSGRLSDRLHFNGYRSGHMMYLRSGDLATANQDLRTFIRRAMPEEGAPAQY